MDMWKNILKVFLNYDSNFEIISFDSEDGLKVKDLRDKETKQILIWKDKEFD